MLKERRKSKYSLESIEIIRHISIRGEFTWMSSKGELFFVKEMDSNYIKNSLNKIERDKLINKEYMVPVLKMELEYRAICNIKQ